MQESLVSDIEMLADDLFDKFRNSVRSAKYGIYGHSLGGLLALLLVRKIVSHRIDPRDQLFITGTIAPSAPRKKNNYHLLERDVFWQKVKSLNGFTSEIWESPELLDFLEPILRADFKAGENYEYSQADPLNIPLTVITGTEEDMELKEIGFWQRETMLKVDFRRLNGHHFFIFGHAQQLLNLMALKLLSSFK